MAGLSCKGCCALLLLATRLGAAAEEQCTVASISPTSGPALGGTLVNLTGLGLAAGSAWRCSFGDALVGAEYHSDAERVGCYSPPLEGGGAAELAVNVSIDGGSSFCDSVTGEPFRFRFYAPPNVSAISPASGTTEGGTVVTVTGGGFAAAAGTVVCAFGSLRVGDEIRAGAVVEATSVADGALECVAPTADAASAVGAASFNFASLPPAEVVQPCVRDTGCVPGVEPERVHRFPNGHNLTLLGDALHEGGLIKLTRNRFSEVGSLLLEVYNPAAPAGVPVRDFDASWAQFVGAGSGADGYAFVYADLSAVSAPFGEMGAADGLVVRFRTHGFFGEYNDGHGIIEALYNGSALNQTFMGDRLRSFKKPRRAVRVVKDAAGLSVYFGGELVLAATLPAWEPAVGWAFGWGARTGDRKDDHWIDDVRVQSGFLLDTGDVAFGVSLNDGHDVSLLPPPGVYTYTTKPAVFSFSPTTGPVRGNTTVTVVGSHFEGGADYRCRFGAAPELKVAATYHSESRALVCASPAARGAQLVPLEVSLNDRLASTSASAVPYRFYAHPAIDDARGPDKVAVPAGVGANISLHGANFSGGDDYRAAFFATAGDDGASSPSAAGALLAVVPATLVNDSLVLCVAPPDIERGSATVALTLNGQQYTAPPTVFPFFAVHGVSPTTGPTRGGTLVSVNGTAFDAGGAYRCSFGAAGVSEASRVDDQTLRCVSPAAAPADAGARPLEVALNARDFTSSHVPFGYYAHPALATALPASGPTAGATLVAVRSVDAGGLAGGSDYRCDFDSLVVAATYVADAPPLRAARGPHQHAELLAPRRASTRAAAVRAGATVPAHGAVLCAAPPNRTAGSAADGLTGAFAITLNGQDYHAAAGGYTYYEMPNVTALGPSRGPAAGGTVLTLVVEPLHARLLNSTSCRVGGDGAGLPDVHSRPVRAVLSPAAAIAPNVVQCVVPPANRTGALGRTFLDFGNPADAGGALYGDAALSADRDVPCGAGPTLSCGGTPADAYDAASSARCEWLCPVRDGVLRLTSGDYGSNGAFVLGTPDVGLAPPPAEFNVSFELFVGRSPLGSAMAPHGDGSLTFNFGARPAGLIGLTGAPHRRASPARRSASRCSSCCCARRRPPSRCGSRGRASSTRRSPAGCARARGCRASSRSPTARSRSRRGARN